MAGKLKPNLGNYDHEPDWKEIIKYFRGSELQNYFTKLLEEDYKSAIKPQYVDSIPTRIKGKVSDIIEKQDARKVREFYLKELDLGNLLDRDINELSGGELQRFAIMIVCMQSAQLYMFDEPSSYLDVKQRLKAAEVIRDLLKQEN